MRGGVLESWKYTSLACAESVSWGLARRKDALGLREVPCLFQTCGRIVFHNGFFVESASEFPEGVRWTRTDRGPLPHSSGPSELVPDSVIMDLNGAYGQDALTVTVEGGVCYEVPLEVIFVNRTSDPIRIAPRVDFVCQTGAAVSLVERHEGQGAIFGAVRVGISVDSAARMEHVRLQSASQESILLSVLNIELASKATYLGRHYTDGARVSRHQIEATLNGLDACFDLESLTLLRSEQVGDLTTVIRHAGPGGRSSQQVRSVLDGQSRGVFQGRVVVAPGADGTDARQSSRALILSKGAEMDTKPELEILADDVKCTHGAATGSLDPQALFYLRTRGIPENQARTLLVEGFAGALLADLPFEDIKREIDARRSRWLDQGL